MSEDSKRPAMSDSPSDATAALFQTGLEQFVQIQQGAFALYAQQTTKALDLLKQLPMMPAGFFELAEQGIRELLRMQQGFVDLMLHQTTAQLDGTMRVAGADGEFGKWMRGSTEYFLALQKQAVDFITQQGFPNWADKGPVAGKGSAAIQGGMEMMLQTQKQFVELFMKPFGAPQQAQKTATSAGNAATPSQPTNASGVPMEAQTTGVSPAHNTAGKTLDGNETSTLEEASGSAGISQERNKASKK